MNDHDVVLYGSDSAALTSCVVPFVASAIQDHGAAIVIATTEHELAFRSALGALAIDTESPATRDRLLFFNASDLVRSLFASGRIERSRFDRLVGRVIRKLGKRYTVHAYGEMVGVLRSMGDPESAARLESLWQELLGEISFRLLCGYPIDVLGSEFHPGAMELILTNHTKLVPALPDFSASLYAGIESRLGWKRAEAIRTMIESNVRPGWAAMGETESTLLWLREHMPDQTEDIIDLANGNVRQSA